MGSINSTVVVHTAASPGALYNQQQLSLTYPMSAKGLHTFPPHIRLSNNNLDSPRAHTPHPHTIFLSPFLPPSLSLTVTKTHTHWVLSQISTHTHILSLSTCTLTHAYEHTFYYNPNSGKCHNKHINRALRWRGIRTHQPCGPSGTTSRPSLWVPSKILFRGF